jgi:hypothetical protein
LLAGSPVPSVPPILRTISRGQPRAASRTLWISFRAASPSHGSRMKCTPAAR